MMFMADLTPECSCRPMERWILRFSLSSNIRQRTKKDEGQAINRIPTLTPLSLNLASMMVMRFQGGPWNPRFLPAHSMISIVGLMWRMDTFEQIL